MNDNYDDSIINKLKEEIIEIEKDSLIKHMDFKNDNSTYSNKSKINEETVKNIIKAVDAIGVIKDEDKKD